jgi:membrane protein YqaA with SNARE-associated domain
MTTRTVFLRGIAVVLVLGISIYIFSIRDKVDEFAVYGYPGIFLIALLSNATVILPAPGIAVVFAMGGVFHPLGVALAAGTGGAIGELSGYLAGYGGRAVLEKSELFAQIQPWVARWGGWTVLLLAAIPNPIFDLAGIAAGSLKMSVWKFFINCWIGQLIKMAAFAFAGSASLPFIFR